MVSFHNLITRVLGAYGFDVMTADGILRGVRNGTTLAIGTFSTADPVEIERFLKKVEGAEGMVIAAFLVEIGDEPRALLESRGIVVWDKNALEEEIGQAILTHLGSGGRGLFAPLAAREPAQGRETPLPLLVEDDGEREAVLKPILGLEDAQEVGRKTVSGFNYHMELAPFYFFEYLCVVRVKGVEGMDKRTGTVGVNALTGEAQPWQGIGEIVHDLEEAHIRLEPKIDQARAERTALLKVVEMSTETVETVTEKEHATVVERVLARPEKDDVTLVPKGLIFVPMWCVEGAHGVMILNAATGKVVSEEFYSDDGKRT
ncbi:MAG: hypothetical protein AB1665_06315 [Candidatus Thermoplasmatota archaeon]